MQGHFILFHEAAKTAHIGYAGRTQQLAPHKRRADALEKELGGEAVAFEAVDGKVALPIGSRCYLKTSLSVCEIVKAFENSKLI